jgi:hypothetical protein
MSACDPTAKRKLMEGRVDHFVNLDKFPDGLELPADLKERIYFDAERRKLVCRGYMSKADFDRISQLTKDWTFRRTLEELFRLSVIDHAPTPTGVRRLLSSLGRLFAGR